MWKGLGFKIQRASETRFPHEHLKSTCIRKLSLLVPPVFSRCPYHKTVNIVVSLPQRGGSYGVSSDSFAKRDLTHGDRLDGQHGWHHVLRVFD